MCLTSPSLGLGLQQPPSPSLLASALAFALTLTPTLTLTKPQVEHARNMFDTRSSIQDLFAPSSGLKTKLLLEG